MAARTAKSKGKPRGPGVPFHRGHDPRRNIKGPVPGVWDLKQELLRDAHTYIDLAFKRAFKSDVILKTVIEQILGRPAQSIDFFVRGEREAALRRLREQLNPDEYERALRAIVGEPGRAGVGADSSGEGADEEDEDNGVDAAAPAVPEVDTEGEP